MSDLATRAAVIPDRWLLLMHQLPAKPAYLRVKIWRRLQALGAVAIKNSVYALPASEQSQEDYDWLLKEIVEAGGEAVIWEARLAGGLTDGEIRALFNAARDTDYAEIDAEARTLEARIAGADGDEARAEAKAQLRRLKARLAEVVAIDHFGADGREVAAGLLAGLEAALAEDAAAAPSTPPQPESVGIAALKDRVWVTRQGVHVDRIACAWLVRRFIDDAAAFKFVPSRGYAPAPGELRFDMVEAEFTHEGDRCSFEVLLERAGLDDPALAAIAEIVHDIDLKDGKFAREEAGGIKMLISGICADTRDDDERVARGMTIFDDLYAVFRRKRGGGRAEKR